MAKKCLGYDVLPEFLIVRPNGMILECENVMDLVKSWRPKSVVYTAVTKKADMARGYKFIQVLSHFKNLETRHRVTLSVSGPIVLETDHDEEKVWYMYIQLDNENLADVACLNDFGLAKGRKRVNALYKQVGDPMQEYKLQEIINELKRNYPQSYDFRWRQLGMEN